MIDGNGTILTPRECESIARARREFRYAVEVMRDPVERWHRSDAIYREIAAEFGRFRTWAIWSGMVTR